jgi:hypothetical protein
MPCPGWRRSVLEVKPDGGDMLVRCIRVAPSNVYCGQSALIGATATRLPNISLDAVAAGVNLCAVDPKSLKRTIRAFPLERRLLAYSQAIVSLSWRSAERKQECSASLEY